MTNESERLWDAYFIKGTNVFKNYLGVTDYEELLKRECEITFEKLVELRLHPITGNFDKHHLCKIHRYLFGEIYPFAGQYRTVDMKKNYTGFVSPKEIDQHLEIVLQEMNDELLQCHSFDDYANFLAEYYYDLLWIHPFREGNGRTIREFLEEFVHSKIPGFALDWSKMNKDNVIEGIKYGFYTKSILAMEFSKALVPIETLNGNRMNM